MNELQHSVITIIEENKSCNSFIDLLLEVKSRHWKNNDDTVFLCFKNNPIDFTRLYEQMSDKIFNVEDKSILEFNEMFFSDEVLAKTKKYLEFFEEIKNDLGPFAWLVLFIAAMSGEYGLDNKLSEE